MPNIPDPIEEGLKKGWQALDGWSIQDRKLPEFDIAVIGTGAGGGTAARTFARKGLRVVMIEEGNFLSSKDFNLNEGEAYRNLYQESLARVTENRAIGIVQGRTVGGSTTINWTSSFRTPPQTLDFWQREYGIKGFSEKELIPWFERLEKEQGVTPWESANANNDILRKGCEKLGIPWDYIPRNVQGCWNLGYCGMGCPTNAKQSMLVTAIPEALSRGATLISRARAQKVIWNGSKAHSLLCQATGNDGKTGPSFAVRAKYFVLAGGGIGTPGVMLRSELVDPHNLIGTRTFLHVTVFNFAQHQEEIAPYHGAPQSIYTDHFQWKDGVEGPMGFKIEVPPLHPILTSALLPGTGKEHFERMGRLPHTSAMIALLRDGFHPESKGGTVVLKEDKREMLDYQWSNYLENGIRRAFLAMTQLQFAAGAKQVIPAHTEGSAYTSWQQAQIQLNRLSMGPHLPKLGSAHVMGGCRFGPSPHDSVVDLEGRFHHLDNLYVMDGSLFPTSIGTNPQLTIYSIVAKLSDAMANRIG